MVIERYKNVESCLKHYGYGESLPGKTDNITDPGFLQSEHWVAVALNPRNRDIGRTHALTPPNSKNDIPQLNYHEVFVQAKEKVPWYSGHVSKENEKEKGSGEGTFPN